MELNVGHLRMVIDEENGAITRMENKATGLVHIDSNPNKILFRITVPQDSWTSRYVDNHFAQA